jgi:hypothetical protein
MALPSNDEENIYLFIYKLLNVLGSSQKSWALHLMNGFFHEYLKA